MRQTIALFTLLLLSACQSGAPTANSSEEALRAANAAYDKALIAGDAKALREAYSDDFRMIDADAEVHGKADQIRFMTEQVKLLHAKTDDVIVRMLSPDAALLTGRFTGRYRLDGREADFTERYTSIWVRDRGKWRLTHEHSSTVPKTK